MEIAKTCLESLLDLIFARCQTGVLDRDPIMKRNFGFIGEKAIEIDLGSFSLDAFLKSPRASKRTLFFETMKLRRWIKKNHPELYSFLEEKIQEKLSQNP